MKDVILTGVRSNDEPTLGNYLGAFVPMVRLQREKAGEFQVNMFVPDLHSFTTPIDHETLYERTLKNLKYFVAAGLDLENTDTYIYRQSYLSAHSELTWILDCFTYMGEMSRMTQYKEKAHTYLVTEDNEKLLTEDGEPLLADTAMNNNVSVGLFNYPVLMAADILLYGAKWVPVGDDQKQHLEITRDIAQRMNHKFGELFIVPEVWTKQLAFTSLDSGVRIRSLTNPDKKMSKSVSDPRGTILLSDEPKVAAKKVMSATTDSIGVVNYDWEKQPGITNLLQIHELLTGQDTRSEWQGSTSYGDLKKTVAEAVEAFLTDFQTKYAAVDDNALIEKLETSEAAMLQTATATLLKVQQAVGLRQKV